jgi:hypothetical protein
MLYRQLKLFVKHNFGQPKTVDEGNWVLAVLAGLNERRLGEMAGRDHSTPGEWLQTSTQFGDLLASDRM